MSEITRVYQVRIWNAAGDAVEYTLDGTDIVGVPEFGWATPRPLEGKIELVPSVVRILDTNEQVTAAIADAGGRAVLMGRIIDIRVNEAGAGYEMRLSGRLSALHLAESVSAFDFYISDERWLEEKEVFASGNTTSLIPAGVLEDFLDAPIAPKMDLRVVEVIDANTIRCGPPLQSYVFPLKQSPEQGGLVTLSQETVDALDADATLSYFEPEIGAFEYARCYAGGADRHIFGFNEMGGELAPMWSFQLMAENGEPMEVKTITLLWTAHGKSVGNTITDCYVYMPNAPASEGNIIHVGGADGVDFFAWLKDRYDEINLRYETAAFTTWNASTNPLGLIANPRCPPVAFRAKAPETLRTVVEKICASMGIVPFTNLAGAVAPRFVFLPQAVDPDTLVEITEAKVTQPHPTWRMTTEDLVTVVTGEYTRYHYVTADEVMEGKEAPTDRIVSSVWALPPLEHDRVAEFGKHVHKLDMTMFVPRVQMGASYYIQTQEIFDRFGDGAIHGAFRGLSALKGVDSGDNVVINVDSFPNPAAQARGGYRIVQIMGRRTERGHVFDYLDTGPKEQPLQPPGVAIVKGANDGYNEVDVTISSLAPSSTYQLQLRDGAGGTWYDAGVGDADGEVTIRGVPSGTAIYARAREAAPGRIRSAWSSPVNATTDTLPACTGLSVDNEAGDRAEFTWTIGTDDFPLEILLDGTRIVTLRPGTSFYVLRGLATSTTYNSPGFQVRHFDLYGGLGTLAGGAFTTTATPTTLSDPYALLILVGGPPV